MRRCYLEKARHIFSMRALLLRIVPVQPCRSLTGFGRLFDLARFTAARPAAIFRLRQRNAECRRIRQAGAHLAYISVPHLRRAAGARLLSGYGEPDARSAAILNNVSPIFIYASFCSGMVGCPRLALYIIPAQFLSAAIMLILFPIRIKPRPQASFSSPLRLLSNALQSSVSAMLNICAALVFFSALMGGFGAMLGAGISGSLSGAVLYGMLEMAGGSAALSKLGIGMRPLGTAAAFVFPSAGCASTPSRSPLPRCPSSAIFLRS